MALTAHKERHIFPPDLYDIPDEPHHIHLAPCGEDCEEDHVHVPVCTDHRIEACPDSHWDGGHPEPSHPHHVEYDGATGRWGYTRLSTEEIADLTICREFLTYDRELAEAKQQKDLQIMRDAARSDHTLAALLRHLGLLE